MKTKLYELKEMLDAAIEKHGESASLSCQIDLKDLNSSWKSGTVDVLIGGSPVGEEDD